MKIKRLLPNLLTAIRIFVAPVLLFLMQFSREYYIMYLICGLTDALDGYYARKYICESTFGAVFDSIADLVFLCIAAYTIVPLYKFHLYIQLAIAFVLLLRIIILIIGLVKNKRFIILHTTENKITGFMLFILPIAQQLTHVDINYLSVPVILMAFYAAIREI